mmetsp:Transcript_106143/g.129460  ORF Transcript_106143/g.129460 Transcript_106143/m.129460 type:complete len:164 (+) Transcript_106143:61-552(+)
MLPKEKGIFVGLGCVCGIALSVLYHKIKMNNTDNSLISGVSHVGLSVKSIDTTYNFFTNLGYNKIGGNAEYPSIFVSNGNTIITIWAINSNNPIKFDRKNNTGLHHLALKVSSKDKLFEIYNKVKSFNGAKIEFKPELIDALGWWHFICYEPNGVRIEFTFHG